MGGEYSVRYRLFFRRLDKPFLTTANSSRRFLAYQLALCKWIGSLAARARAKTLKLLRRPLISLIFQKSDSLTPTENAVTPVADARDIMEVASGLDDSSTLIAVVKAADLAETLSGEKPFTVFAATDAAFEALPAGTVEELSRPRTESST